MIICYFNNYLIPILTLLPISQISNIYLHLDIYISKYNPQKTYTVQNLINANIVYKLL